MTSPSKLAANRANALLSTGPRTALGKAAASLNAVATGLHSRQLVLAALGETHESLDLFRAAVIANLEVRGVVEREIADHIAQLLWRRRRIAAAETASLVKSATVLPADPDTVTGDGVDTSLRLPLDASSAAQLGRVRALLHKNHLDQDRTQELIESFDEAAASHAPDVNWMAARLLLRHAASELGWKPFTDPDPWNLLLRELGIDPVDTPWTPSLLRTLIETAAEKEKRNPEAVFDAAMARVRQQADDLDAMIATRMQEEQTLATAMRTEREQAAAALVAADDRLVKTVTRLERHLSRELESSLTMLRQLQAARTENEPAPSAAGFVLARDVNVENNGAIAIATG